MRPDTTLTQLFQALQVAISERDLDAVKTYSQAIQRLTVNN